MSQSLQGFLLLAIALYFIALVYLMRRKRILLRYMLLWIVSGVIMVVLTLFPGLLTRAARVLGIYEPVNALFAIALFCVLMILMALTAILSHHNAAIVRLVQTNALLEQRIRELEERAAQKEDKDGGGLRVAITALYLSPTGRTPIWRSASVRSSRSACAARC